jgi:hypothetical protein
MPKRARPVRPVPTRRSRCAALLRSVLRWMMTALACTWRLLTRPWRRGVAIEVLSTNLQRRRTLERELRSAVRRLRRTVGTPPLDGLAVVAQQVLGSHRPLAGCTQITHAADGASFALIRLALVANDRPLSADDVLAALAEQWIGLVGQRAVGASVLVPIEFAPPERHQVDSARASHALRAIRPRNPAGVPGAYPAATPLRADPLDPLAPMPFSAPERNGHSS